MRVLLLCLVVLGLAGCEPASSRCERVASEDMTYRIYTDAFNATYGIKRPPLLTRQDTLYWEERDSMRARALRVVPPRPSDLRWHAEHCYAGHAR